jgi:leucyl aminopeptidase
LIEKYLKPLLKARRTKHFAHNGKVRAVRHYADNDTRIAALDMTFRLKGNYAPIKTREEKRQVAKIIIDIPRPIHTPEQLAERAQQTASENNKLCQQELPKVTP